MASACVVAFDDATDLAWSKCEWPLFGVWFHLELLGLLAGARLGFVLVLEALGEWNHAAAPGPGHLRDFA